MIGTDDGLDLTDLTDDQLTALAQSCVTEAVSRGEAAALAAQSILLSGAERQRAIEATRSASTEQARMAAIRAIREDARIAIERQIASGELTVVTPADRQQIAQAARAEAMAIAKKNAIATMQSAERAAETARATEEARGDIFASLSAIAESLLPAGTHEVNAWSSYDGEQRLYVNLDGSDTTTIRYDKRGSKLTASGIGALKRRADVAAWCARTLALLTQQNTRKITLTVTAGGGFNAS